MRRHAGIPPSVALGLVLLTQACDHSTSKPGSSDPTAPDLLSEFGDFSIPASKIIDVPALTEFDLPPRARPWDVDPDALVEALIATQGHATIALEPPPGVRTIGGYGGASRKEGVPASAIRQGLALLAKRGVEIQRYSANLGVAHASGPSRARRTTPWVPRAPSARSPRGRGSSRARRPSSGGRRCGGNREALRAPSSPPTGPLARARSRPASPARSGTPPSAAPRPAGPPRAATRAGYAGARVRSVPRRGSPRGRWRPGGAPPPAGQRGRSAARARGRRYASPCFLNRRSRRGRETLRISAVRDLWRPVAA